MVSIRRPVKLTVIIDYQITLLILRTSLWLTFVQLWSSFLTLPLRFSLFLLPSLSCFNVHQFIPSPSLNDDGWSSPSFSTGFALFWWPEIISLDDHWLADSAHSIWQSYVLSPSISIDIVNWSTDLDHKIVIIPCQLYELFINECNNVVLAHD